MGGFFGGNGDCSCILIIILLLCCCGGDGFGFGREGCDGGGFGGSVQCFVPLDMVEDFTAQMNAWLGEGACVHYQIAEKGAHATWL